MHTLGPIIRIQIQRSRLKTGEKPHRVYRIEPLLAVEHVRVTPDGLIANHQGADVLDVHHREHPDSRNVDGQNGLSLGFTSHYDAMRERFGPHMALGVAGENLIVETDRRVTAEELAAGITILDPAGRAKLTVASLRPAAPCRPFAGFALEGARVGPEEMKAILEFLHQGTRGFYGIVEGIAEVAVGDVVAVG